VTWHEHKKITMTTHGYKETKLDKDTWQPWGLKYTQD